MPTGGGWGLVTGDDLDGDDQRVLAKILMHRCMRNLESAIVQGSGEQGEARRKGRLALIPLGRFGQPVDVAEMAVFLASEESSWLTGAAIPLDGGLTAY